MRTKALCGVLAILAICLCGLQLPPLNAAPTDEAVRKAITAVLQEQQLAWNRGDVEAFMKGYWNSPELTFAGTAGITRGWDAVLARYRKNYADTAAMGQLEFSALEIRVLGKDVALVLGRWHLKRDSGDVSGVFSLVFRRFPHQRHEAAITGAGKMLTLGR
jgi:uncharacterized protein (TIGR02246 family)